MEDLYEFHFNYMLRDVLKHIQSPKSLVQLLNTMKHGSYSHPDFAKEAILHFQNIADFQISEMARG